MKLDMLESFQELQSVANSGFLVSADDGFSCVCVAGIADVIDNNVVLHTEAPQLFKETSKNPEVRENYTSLIPPDEVPEELHIVFPIHATRTIAVIGQHDAEYSLLSLGAEFGYIGPDGEMTGDFSGGTYRLD